MQSNTHSLAVRACWVFSFFFSSSLRREDCRACTAAPQSSPSSLFRSSLTRERPSLTRRSLAANLDSRSYSDVRRSVFLCCVHLGNILDLCALIALQPLVQPWFFLDACAPSQPSPPLPSVEPFWRLYGWISSYSQQLLQ